MKNVKAGHTKPIVSLDAGHYGKYNQSPAVPEYYESDMNWKLHLKLKAELEKYGIEVRTTRADKDTDLGLTARGRKADGCDVLLSIHSNAVGDGVNESVDYPVVYVPLNGSADILGRELAECIANVMGTTQKGESKTRKGSGDWDYYSVIYGAVDVGTPGLILEHSFHTNTKATKWLMVDSNLDKLAQAEAKIVAEWFGMTAVKAPEPEHWYRIRKTWADANGQTAAYKNLDNAIKACPIGYSVFDWNGKAVYTHTPQPEVFTITLPVLRKGDNGGMVKALQQLLMANGINLPKYGADGDFGGETEAGVIAYQKKVGITADGAVGTETVGSLLGVN